MRVAAAGRERRLEDGTDGCPPSEARAAPTAARKDRGADGGADGGAGGGADARAMAVGDDGSHSLHLDSGRQQRALRAQCGVLNSAWLEAIPAQRWLDHLAKRKIGRAHV